MDSSSELPTKTGIWEFNVKNRSLEFRPFAHADLAMTTAKIDQLKSFIERRSVCPASKTTNNPSTNDTDVVTLNLLKSVAEKKTSQEEKDILESFYAIYNSEQFDKFLLNLLRYFHYFCEREELNRKQKKEFLSAHSSHSNVHHKLGISQRLLGQSYCALILGLGLESQHHMNCGKSRVSATENDQKTYETLYKFCATFIWIAFLRKDRKMVDKEIGRLLRSEKFNPALQKISVYDHDSKKFSKRAELRYEDVKITVTKHKKEPRRPAIKRIIHQKSPVLESVFPAPKDQSPWLFKKKISNNHLIFSGSNIVTYLENDDQRNLEIFDECFEPSDYRYGILGEQLNRFTEDLEENENKDLSGPQSQQSSTQEEEMDLTDDKSDDRRQAISRATTEVSSEDEGD